VLQITARSAPGSVTELECDDGSRIGEPHDEVEALIREPSAAWFLVQLSCPYFL
jgi:hypothetical protein